jgi:glycosyltransferase involved in cell wall biosynthesis
MPEASLANKRKYLETLREFPVCVATTGLNGSNGWKLAEYVAQSKAIITEPLRYTVPGDFKAGQNYVEFNDADELVDAASRLLDDASLRSGLMNANHTYYLSYVRPDALVRNTLDIVLNAKG